MTQPIGRDTIYRCRRFSAETIELCVRWYTTNRLSYRNLAAMMAEREVIVAHTTIMRWVLQYVPEYERRWTRFARPPGGSWRVDETAVAVRGGRHCLFRGVDKNGKSIGSLLCNDRDMESAQADRFEDIQMNCRRISNVEPTTLRRTAKAKDSGELFVVGRALRG
jgi:transposase-like protein